MKSKLKSKNRAARSCAPSPGSAMMTKNTPGDTCEICGAPEVDAMTPRTVYACGSSDYDKRPGTFRQGASCHSPNEKAVPTEGGEIKP